LYPAAAHACENCRALTTQAQAEIVLTAPTSPPEQIRRQRVDGRETYAALLDAALAIWSEEGIDNVTMNAVAKRAGKTRGIMYHHFAGRDDLIAALHSHLDDRLSHLFDISKVPGRNDFLIVAGIVVDSPDLMRSYLQRLLSRDPKQDPLMQTARDHYQTLAQLDWLQPGMNPDHAAVISISMWLASMLAVDLKQGVAQRRAEAIAFAETFRRVMEAGVNKPETERGVPEELRDQF
jgi:AcrR family transcriptional regulator